MNFENGVVTDERVSETAAPRTDHPMIGDSKPTLWTNYNTVCSEEVEPLKRTSNSTQHIALKDITLLETSCWRQANTFMNLMLERSKHFYNPRARQKLTLL